MGIEWKATGRIGNDVTVWDTRYGGLLFSVHRLLKLKGWYLTCHDLQVADRQIIAQTENSAKQEAVRMVRALLKGRIQKYREILKSIGG